MESDQAGQYLYSHKCCVAFRQVKLSEFCGAMPYVLVDRERELNLLESPWIIWWDVIGGKWSGSKGCTRRGVMALSPQSFSNSGARHQSNARLLDSPPDWTTPNKRTFLPVLDRKNESYTLKITKILLFGLALLLRFSYKLILTFL